MELTKDNCRTESFLVEALITFDNSYLPSTINRRSAERVTVWEAMWQDVGNILSELIEKDNHSLVTTGSRYEGG